MTQPDAKKGIKHFYIPEEQSVYLLSHSDAKRLKDWFSLCISELTNLGYSDIELIGSGAFGFVFGGYDAQGHALVFKFSRLTLPTHVQERLEEEGFMLSHVVHSHVPAFVEYQQQKKLSILVMQRALGADMEKYSLQNGPLSAQMIVKLAVQIGSILLTLRHFEQDGIRKPIVHGDIKPSNLVWDENKQQVDLIDWGSSVFAQVDENGQYTANNVMDLMSGDLQQTNARLGDVYYIGDEQLNGELSSPRYDEQGLASTLYALASGQSSRFGRKVILPSSLGLPKLLSDILDAMLCDDPKRRRQGGDYLLNNLHVLRQLVFSEHLPAGVVSLLPTWLAREQKELETVVYSSRKSFLRQHNEDSENTLRYLNDAQFDRYYKNYMQGMGDNEKAFIAAISRLGNYPVVGGLVIRWEKEGIYVDSSLYLHQADLQPAFDHSVNNVIYLARAIHLKGLFKCCMFDAKQTLHVERASQDESFVADPKTKIHFETSSQAEHYNATHDANRMHSYFEDGEDPDEQLELPESIIEVLTKLNDIHHTGCIIFESLPKHLKIHNYYHLLDPDMERDFTQCLDRLVELIPQIVGVGISGFMKLPYKDTRFFSHQASLPEKYYPRDPKHRKVGSN